MASGTGITWPELYNFLTGTAGCTEVSWQPGNHVTLRTPQGREFGTCRPEKTGYVSPNHLVAVANVFGRNWRDFETWMGRKPAGKSKVTRKRSTGAKIPPPHAKRISNAARDLEVTAIKIANSRATKTLDKTAVDDLERLTQQAKTCFDQLVGGAK